MAYLGPVPTKTKRKLTYRGYVRNTDHNNGLTHGKQKKHKKKGLSRDYDK